MKKKSLETVVELKNLVKVFGKETVVDDVNLRIKKGEFVTLLGPSGCGKTTILRMVAGFERPTSGVILLDGKDVSKLPPHLRPVNTVFQKYALFPHLSVFGNIAYGLKLKKTPKAEIQEKVDRVLKLVGLGDYGHRDIDSLSGGQQQRVAIARAIVNEPRVLLLDEPLGALDLKMRKEMQAELRRMHKEVGITFVYVTHDQEEAMAMSDTIVVINDGQIQQVGTPKQIYDTPSNAFVADFIGESNIISGVMESDFNVRFLGKTFKCTDKGFQKNQPVDVVIRPEDIVIHNKATAKTQLKGVVTSCIFVGMIYEIEIDVDGYVFTVQGLREFGIGTTVSLEIDPTIIHVMPMESTINEFETEMESDNSVKIAGTYFDLVGEQSIEKGTKLVATIPFNKVELTDDPDDSKIKGTVTHTLYRGTYYHVKVWTDTDDLFIVHTSDEWDIDDRVGVKFDPANIAIEIMTPDEEVADES